MYVNQNNPTNKQGLGRRFTERDIIERLDSPNLSLGPVALKRVENKTEAPWKPQIDGYIDAFWRGQTSRFVIEIKTLSTPKSIESAMSQARIGGNELGLLPMIVVPYLNRGQLAKLDRMEISGVDMCGNGLITAPDFRVWEAGNPNLYPEPTTLRNPYSGDSSIFARSFLINTQFSSLTELREFAATRTMFRIPGQGDLQMGTASKVVRALSEELIVVNSQSGLGLIDRKALMERLKVGYERRRVRNLIGTTPLGNDEIWRRLSETRALKGLRSAATGIASAGHYGVLSGVDRLSLYVDELDDIGEVLEIKEGRSFANIELMEAEKNLSFFDTRKDGLTRWASPIQTWLELAQAGPREAEAAQRMHSWFGLT
jgi:hypothetical protein